MTISRHADVFAGRFVEEFDATKEISEPDEVAYALRTGWDSEQTFAEQLFALKQHPQASIVEALVIGQWADEAYGGEDSRVAVEALVDAREHFPNLKALFIGDITYEESEISWIEQSNMTPLLDAYPALEVFQVRGGNGLRFESLRHEALKELIIETGGLSRTTIADICAADLPNLERLELWLGSDNYGGDATIKDLEPILSGDRFPKLTHLGLMDSEIADEIAKAIVKAPILKQLDVLDLSMGILLDEAAQVLLAGLTNALLKLKRLDLSENYLSDEMVKRFSKLPFKVWAYRQKDLDEDDPEWRYVSVAE